MHFLAIDGLSIVRRIHEAIPTEESPEKAEGTIKSSISSLRRALLENRPSHALAVFDYGGFNWRHDIYPDYKKDRKPMPPELHKAMPRLVDEIEGMGLRCISVPGVEADDVIAALVNTWCSKTTERFTILSTDKDLCQLLEYPQVIVRDHFTSSDRDSAWVVNKFGVTPAQLGDLFALWGDKVDGIPGVEKVGIKTATAWLTEYGSLEGVLSNADKIKGKVGENLRRDVELAKLSKRLVSFKTDITLGLTLKMLVQDIPS